MELIEITDKNKYEIVSKLREYKHKIIDLASTEFDITLPLIKDYIFSISPLKDRFMKQCREYIDVVESPDFLSFVDEYNEIITKPLANSSKFSRETTSTVFLDWVKSGWISFDDMEELDFIYKSTIQTMLIGFLSFYKNFNGNECPEIGKLASFLENKLIIISDYYYFYMEEVTPFNAKKTNFLKIAVFTVLSDLELIVLNKKESIKGEERHIAHNNQKYLTKFKKEHLELLKLRKDLSPNGTYEEISKKINGKYSISSLKALAREINTMLGTRNIDEAVRIFENQYGIL